VTIRWKRPVEGFVESHDGRWHIKPNYFSCVRAQSFQLVRDGKTVSYMCATQRDAKAEADRLVAPCYCNGKGCDRRHPGQLQCTKCSGTAWVSGKDRKDNPIHLCAVCKIPMPPPEAD